jgi:SagB-type dehydrogenase family enzyme
MFLQIFNLLLIFLLSPGGVMADSSNTIELPEVSLTGDGSLEQLLSQRRSIREYAEGTVSLNDVGQLLWAAQGITNARGLRTAPSAGALYPLELFLVVGEVNHLSPGVYHYRPDGHQLQKVVADDQRKDLGRAAGSQDWIKEAAVVIVVTADYERTARKYALRAKRYVHIEVGHAAQNLLLQAEALNLATVPVGAFRDDEVARILQLPDELEPLMLLPVGRKSEKVPEGFNIDQT